MYRNQRPKHVVLFKLPAQFGSEAILKAINTRSNWKVHVSKDKLGSYLYTSDLSGCVDDDFDKAQWIHACDWSKEAETFHSFRANFQRNLPCQAQNLKFTVRQIKPSAMFFHRRHLEDYGMSYHEGGEFHRVCYSSHSSLSELVTFVKYFKPGNIVPIVMPPGMKSIQDVLHLLSPSFNGESIETSNSSSQLTCHFESSPTGKRSWNSGQKKHSNFTRYSSNFEFSQDLR